MKPISMAAWLWAVTLGISSCGGSRSHGEIEYPSLESLGSAFVNSIVTKDANQYTSCFTFLLDPKSHITTSAEAQLAVEEFEKRANAGRKESDDFFAHPTDEIQPSSSFMKIKFLSSKNLDGVEIVKIEIVVRENPNLVTSFPYDAILTESGWKLIPYAVGKEETPP